jgi:5'-methylthioadenosine phosphorylase
MPGWTIGIIGGSGLYQLDALKDAQWIAVDTPWGAPSDEVLFGRVGEVRVRFIPRHGRGHRLPPADVNARANIDALKRAGCTDILAISSVGSLREALSPGRFVAVDQLVDRTCGRPASFFGPGMVAHVSLADPVCPRLAGLAADAVAAAKGKVARGGTYLAIDGAQFSTRAESALYRKWGCDVIGMTAMPEARLAREAELPYALLGMVTDYDCWREGDEVEMNAVMAQMDGNAELARGTVERFLAALPAKREPSPIDTALDKAVVTAPEARDPTLLAQLDAVAGRYLRGG